MGVILDRAVIFSPERVAAARAAQAIVIPPDEVLQAYCEKISNITGSQMAFVTLVFDHSHHFIAGVGFPKGQALSRPGEQEGTFTQVACAFLVSAGHPISFPDTHEFDFLAECVPMREVRSYTAAPVRFRGQVIGSFGVCDFQPKVIGRRHFRKLTKMADKLSSELRQREPS